MKLSEFMHKYEMANEELNALTTDYGLVINSETKNVIQNRLNKLHNGIQLADAWMDRSEICEETDNEFIRNYSCE